MQPHIIEFPRIHDPRGNLTPVEHPAQLPYTPQRVYWLYDVPSDSERGGHAHRQCLETLVAITGSFTVHLLDANGWQHITLDRPWRGLLIPSNTWRTIDNFTSGATCLVLASLPYDEQDYIRHYQAFVDEFAIPLS